MPIISPKIPSGLEELMRGLAKSVIKENPQNIYEFAAEYFENLLKERDGSVDQSYKKFATYKVYKKNKNARMKREKENSNDVNGVPADNGFSKDAVAVNYGDVTSYDKKDSSDEKSIEEIILPASSTPMQAIAESRPSISSESEKNTSLIRKVSSEVHEDDTHKSDAKSNEDEDIKNMVLDEDMAQAALKIQSTFRGHQVRREMKEIVDKTDVVEEIVTKEEKEEVSNSEIELKQSIERDPETNDNIRESVTSENKNDEAEVLEASKDEIAAEIDSNDDKNDDIDDDVANMVLDDEMEQAALKIQSTFRGHKVRKEVKPASLQKSVDDKEESLPEQLEGSVILKAEDVDNGSIQVECDESMNDEAIELPVDESVQAEGLVQNENVEIESEATDEQKKVEETEVTPEILTVDEKVEKVDSQVAGIEEVADASVNVSEIYVESEAADDNMSEKLEKDEIEPAGVEEVAEASANSVENFVESEAFDENLSEKSEKEEDAPAITNDEVIESFHSTVDEANEPQEKHSEDEKDEGKVAGVELEKTVEENEKNSDLPEEEIEGGEKSEEFPEVASAKEFIASASLPEEAQEMANNQSGDDVTVLDLEKDLNTDAEIPTDKEEPRVEEIDDNLVELAEAIELTDEIQNNKRNENVEESKILDTKPAESGSVEAEEENITNIEVNEQEPQHELNELSNESETENIDIEVKETLDEINIDCVPVVEDICEKKIVHDLEPDQEIDESEMATDGIKEKSKEKSFENTENHEKKLSIQEKSAPSTEVKYSTLKESISDKGESNDEIDEKSQDLTDEKSIDGDETCGSNKNSFDEKVEELQCEESEQLCEDKKQEGSSNDVDDIEMNSSQPTEVLEKSRVVESILQKDISPIELLDEVVNEYAGIASKLLNENVEELDQGLNHPESLEKTEEQTVQPQLNEENPLKEIEAPKSIDLFQEIVHVSQDEMEPIIDEILQPEGEESEIPEETKAPMDESVPTIAMNNESSTVLGEENLPNDEEKEKSEPKVEDGISEITSDEVIKEDAASKIQDPFRSQSKEQDGEPEENTKEKSAENSGLNVVIDQCSEDVQDSQNQEETEQQDTSADVEEIEEAETVDQEETLEETPEEENEAEEETALESEENETTEQGGENPDGTPEDETESAEQQQNNDDDDVANMVLDEEMEQAALKIQSTFRGHKTRKDIKKDEPQGEASSSVATEESKDPIEDVDDEIANMVLDDEMEQAALKIQSTFRGHKTRKDIKKDDNADEDDNNNDEKPEDKKEEEEEKPEEEPSQSSSTEKSAKQMQEEEDIANLVMDAEMEQTALKIQSAFRGKARKKVQKDGVESTGSSGEDQSEEDENDDKQEDDPFRQNEEMSQENAYSGEKSYDDEKGSNYSAHYSQLDDGKYSIDRHSTSSDVEPLYFNTSIDDLNLMQGGGIFPEPSGESSDMLTGCSGDDKDPNDRQSTYDKASSHEIDETINQHEETLDPLNDEECVIKNFDFVANKDTAEAMYYSLKKNELETHKTLSEENQLDMSQQSTEAEEILSAKMKDTLENQSTYEDEDDDDVVVGVQLSQPLTKRLKYGMSMDDRLLGSILSQDYTSKVKNPCYPDDGFDPLLEATMKNQRFLEKLHEMSKSDEDKEPSYDDYPGDDEDQFDDFYNSNSIRQKMMASSVSIADSDYFDPTNNKSAIGDDKIRTALETIHSSDSESTIASAATKIQAGDRMISKRNNNHSMQYSSIGNAAIDRSLDEFIQSQELRIDRFDEELEGYNSPPPRQHESIDDWTDDTTTYTDSDKKDMAGGVIEIKLEQKTSFLTVDERRRTLHREDAIQRNSTREDEDSSKSSNASREKLNVKENATKATEETITLREATAVDTEVHATFDVTEKSKPSSTSLKPHRMKRQHTMPVQIQTDVIRVVPKHLRKRIKSADGEKNRRVTK